MTKVKKTVYAEDAVLNLFRKKAEKILSDVVKDKDLQFSTKEIQELLHQIQVQHIELEMQNDELKLSNEEVENQRHKFVGLYDLAPVGYFILDHNGIILEVNTTGCNQLESAKRTIVNRRFQSFLDSSDADAFYLFFRRIFNSSEKQSNQFNLYTAKGKTIYTQVEGIVIRDSFLGKEQCYLAVIDITERRKAELKLQETKERLEMALDASVTGTWQMDLGTKDILLDKFSWQIYGVKDPNSVQTLDSFVKRIHPDDWTELNKQFQDAIQYKHDLEVEYRIIKPDGNIAYISARGHVIERPGSSKSFVGILMDITHRKEMEEEAMKLKAEHQKNILTAVFRAQENERKRISEALHDSVSQLLYGIKLKLQDYKRTDKDGAVFTELNTLLDLAVSETRNISFELAPAILNDFGLCTALEEMSKRLNTTDLKIHLRVSGLKSRFDLNKELSIFRIIQELVNNVIKHAKATELKIEATRKNKSLRINVKDNGRGFNKNEIKASGSGLHSIKNRLDLLNGTMDIQSEEGAGTLVDIKFREIF
ncbi:PAS domain S-box protein [Pedobacter sp. P351]|uniref:PAS domain-containing sensor histidine kinase n=1 Tax=Pedobacter superstes TaxID=3133441 RepID=UPI0030A20213